MTRYQPTHHRQYDSVNARTRSSGCTWTSGAMGADASTGGRIDPTPDQVLAKVKRSEETSPQTPGWSLADLARACQRMGVPFAVRAGKGWAGVRAARKAGLFVVLQGDSDRFPDGCSGKFDGDHAIGIPPDDTNAKGEWATHDPICPGKTYEPESVLRAYAEKFAPGVAFGVFTTPVPPGLPDTDTEPPAMKLTNMKDLTGRVTLQVDYHLWNVHTDTKTTGQVPKGTSYEAYASCTYHQRIDAPEGWPGYLVQHGGEAHIVPAGKQGQIAKYAPSPNTEAFNLGVEAAAKAAASVKR